MSLEEAKKFLFEKRIACYETLVGPARRQRQNRNNKCIERWRKLHKLETAEDYRQLAAEMYSGGQATRRKGRIKRSDDQVVEEHSSQHIAKETQKSNNEVFPGEGGSFQLDRQDNEFPPGEDMNIWTEIPPSNLYNPILIPPDESGRTLDRGSSCDYFTRSSSSSYLYSPESIQAETGDGEFKAPFDCDGPRQSIPRTQGNDLILATRGNADGGNLESLRGSHHALGHHLMTLSEYMVDTQRQGAWLGEVLAEVKSRLEQGLQHSGSGPALCEQPFFEERERSACLIREICGILGIVAS